MALEFKFPDVGEGVTEGTIVKWKVLGRFQWNSYMNMQKEFGKS